ncbi:MAG TPA: tyrosine-type recombinase/integrase [Bryobacteraceae bacterium]|nr:tyrosine-type recombinase/integrase [Bryobacteraceae bacterium]
MAKESGPPLDRQDDDVDPEYERFRRPPSGEVRAALGDFAKRLMDPDPILKGLLAPDSAEEHINALAEAERQQRRPLTLTGNWRRAFRRLCEIAGVKDGHAHRFRDTLAVQLLLEGVPMERVSILLGHSSVKVTERHYAPWVQARQAQLEADVARVWNKDPILQAELLRTETVALDGRPQ